MSNMIKNICFSAAAAVFTCLFLLSCATIDRLERMQDDFSSLDSYFSDRDIPKFDSSMPSIYFTGTEWNERSLELIRNAQDYILITIFLGNYHESTHEVWELLRKRMQEGIRVYMIIDSSSYFQFDPEQPDIVIPAVFSHLEKLGIPYVEYNPFTVSNLFFVFNMLDRDHRKFWIIDGEIIAAGGTNINYTSLGLPPETGNIDTMAEVHAPEAAAVLVSSFVDIWNSYSPFRLNRDDFSAGAPSPEEQELTSFWLIDHHWSQSPQVTDMFDAFFLFAEEQLWMIQGYAFLTPALTRRIQYAVEKGVEVNIMLSDYARKDNYELASRYGILDLIDAGANVYMYTSPIGAFLHYKLMLADGRLAALGSVNYNLRSQTLSREISFVFDNPQIGRVLLENIDDLMVHARPVTREEALEYRTFRGLLYFLLMQFWG